MALNILLTSSANWVWEQYGKTLADKALGKAHQMSAKFQWKDAETKYRSRMLELYSTTRLLGYSKPIVIEEIFTDVILLNKLSAFRNFNIEQLEAQKSYGIIDSTGVQRMPGLEVALREKRLYILGKPGSGKSTFLKYLTLQACKGKIPYTPIFVSLKEWADSGLDLFPHLVKQFEICAFPDAEVFLSSLLEKGGALVLFDGLDEVNQEGNQRNVMINVLTQFARQYPNTHICVTCRVAASDYSFDQFNYLEIADFNEQQMYIFITKWYQDDEKRLEGFLKGFNKLENGNLHDLARTPLLLALLCLAYDETLDFPMRRVDLYKEALEALLKKWDSSRGIRRDEIYRKLSPARKEQMLARIAATNFENGAYFIRKHAVRGRAIWWSKAEINCDMRRKKNGLRKRGARSCWLGMTVSPGRSRRWL